MIVWRDKLLAFGIHFLATLVIGAFAAALIFLVWFPDPFQTMVRGTELFLLVVGCDLALGPLLSLVVFNRSKSRRELFFDYSIIAVIQIGALVYGIHSVAGSRPVYVAFAKDRLEVVTAQEYLPEELAAAHDPQYRTLPWNGPRFVSIVVPLADNNDALFKALGGVAESARPKFFMPYEHELPEIQSRAKPLAELEQRLPKSRPLIADAVAKSGLKREALNWLPVSCRRGFWTALIEVKTGRPVAYFDLDPYGDVSG
jgi:hypothetical protein